MKINSILFVATTLATIATTSVLAGVPAADAAKLKGELTPFGAEKKGNADGSIPAWNGGFRGNAGGKGGKRTDPFASEKPLFSITAQNVGQYSDRLSDGAKAMLKKYPQEFRIDVYPTHRTANAPQWVYDNTFKNATNGKIVNGLPKGVYGGIPFPIPKTGEEVMWNHLMRWAGESWDFDAGFYQITKDGKPVFVSAGRGAEQFPFYYKEGNAEKWDAQASTVFWMIKSRYYAPALRSGEGILTWEGVNPKDQQTWVYLAGQRRTRKLPNACCDTPTPMSAGVMSFDEIYTWTGRIDKFNWRIVGKKEMYVPYNGNKFMQPPVEKLLGKHGYNPDYMRWELHRVWVVEANLKPGQRHQAPKSRYYCDEDTWICVLGDRWDAKGQLWKTLWTQTFVAPDLPGILVASFGYNDLLSDTAFLGQVFNGKQSQVPLKPRRPDSFFAQSALAGDSTR